MHNDLKRVLTADMKGLYGLVYANLEAAAPVFLRSRQRPYADFRHLVRYLTHRERPATYSDIAEAEAGLAPGLAPADHSTILHSCRVAKARVLSEQAELYGKMSFWYDVAKSRETPAGGPGYLARIRRFQAEPGHVKSLLLAGLVEHKLVNAAVMQVLLNEYRRVDEGYLNELLTNE